MAKRSTDRAQLDLFAEPESEEPAAPKEWVEISQALFLSWSPRMQLKYCAERDRTSAVALPEDAGWYLERARGYEADATESV